jgi:hypothetical protein
MSNSLQKAIATIKAGNKSTGRQLLTDILKTEPDNEQAWLWMTKVVDSNSERVECLQKALQINPNNETAQYVLASLQGQDSSTPESEKSSTASSIKSLKKISGQDQPVRKPLKRLSTRKYVRPDTAKNTIPDNPPSSTPIEAKQAPPMSNAAALQKIASDRQRGITANLSSANLQGTDLFGTDLSEVSMYNVNLKEANLKQSNLRHSILNGADLSQANLNESNLSEARLEKANLYGADLSNANLNGAHFNQANLGDANLSGSNLSWANLIEADLRGANLYEANLREAKLHGADFRGADLRWVKLREALYTNTTRWPDDFNPDQKGAIRIEI